MKPEDRWKLSFFLSSYRLKSNPIYLDLSQIESCDDTIELTKEQVKAALTSLISNHKQTRTAASRKRRRNESLEKPTKKSKQISNDIILSNINQPEAIVLATSGLNQHQMVSLFCLFCL